MSYVLETGPVSKTTSYVLCLGDRTYVIEAVSPREDIEAVAHVITPRKKGKKNKRPMCSRILKR
jgi:hypothetical protein